MAITYTSNFASRGSGESASITSGTLSASVGDFICVLVMGEGYTTGETYAVSNNNTAITWTSRRSVKVADNCSLELWTGTVSGTPPTTITVTLSNGSSNNQAKYLHTSIHTGAHATTPLPTGNIYSGSGATDVSQSITPTSSGSCLWLGGDDWNATNSFAARTSCTLQNNQHTSGLHTGCIVRPTTQPRTDATAFTIGETDTSGKISWIAWEVQAAASGAVTHATTGVLANAGAAIAGTSAHIAKHATSGVLANSGAAVSGTAKNFTPHATSGVLANAGATIAGTALNFTPHATTGVLVNTGAAIAGSSLNFTPHATSGAIANTGAALVGAALNFTSHATSGTLSNAGAAIAGTSAHIAKHATSGVLANAGAAIAGVSDHTIAGGAHPTEGALTTSGATVTGTAAHIAKHATTGALASAGAMLVGAALNYTPHATTGVLANTGATLSGTALHSFAVNHETSGALAGWGAEITGYAVNGTVSVSEHFSGNYGGHGKPNKKRKSESHREVIKVDDEPQELFIADALMASRDTADSGIELIDGIDYVDESERIRRYKILAAAALLTAH